MSSVDSSTPSAVSPDPAAAPVARTLESRLAGVAGELARLRASRRLGPLAELRRLQPVDPDDDTERPGQLPGESFWALVQKFGIPIGEEAFWLAVLPLMVRHPHQRGSRPGRALEAALINKSRFERWLRQDRAGAWREAPRLLSKLKDQGLDWVVFGSALNRWRDDDRYCLARDFFLARERRDHTHIDGAE